MIPYSIKSLTPYVITFRRPMTISKEEYNKRYEKIFGKKKKVNNGKKNTK